MQNIDMKIPTAANARKMVEESILGSSNQTKEKILKEHYLHLGYKWDHKDGQRDCDYIILSW